MAFAPGHVIANRYEVQAVMHATALSEVYRVHDRNEDFVGVLKLMNPAALPGGPWAEAQHLRRLRDDHILEIRNADVYLGVPYLVTALAEHGTLEDRLLATAGTGLDVDDVVAWISQAALGIQRANDAGLVHNDVKPGNLFLTATGDCLVGDFGLASLVPVPPLVGVAFGATPQTVAPEVAAGAPTGAMPTSYAADVFSLGATAFWLLADTPPIDFSGARDMAQRFAAAASLPTRRLRDLAPHVPAGVASVIEKAISRSPTDRYASATEFANALTRRTTRPRRWRRTNQHPGHIGCWVGEQPGRSTYVMCVEPGATARQCIVTTRHAVAPNARVPNGARQSTITKWPVAVRVLIDRLSA